MTSSFQNNKKSKDIDQLLASAVTCPKTQIHAKRSKTQPDIFLCEIDGEKFVLKTYERCGFLIRNLWGRWVTKKEFSNLNSLQNVEGVPVIYGIVQPCGILMEHIKGAPLRERKKAIPDRTILEKLESIVNTVHKRHIAHGDIRRKNILVTTAGVVYLIDWATAFRWKEKGNMLARSFFRNLCHVDRIKIIEMKEHYYPGSLTEEEQKQLLRKSFYLRVGQFLRHTIYRNIVPHKRRRRRRRNTKQSPSE